jgi:hypothetical protein
MGRELDRVFFFAAEKKRCEVLDVQNARRFIDKDMSLRTQ